MKCAIMQPTLLPWAGFFRMMREVERFVFLDDVQLSKQSWQTRNRILVNNRPNWIVVPIKHEKIGQTILDTEVTRPSRWRIKTVKTLRQSYARYPFISDLDELIRNIENGKETNLADLNINLIKFCAEKLGIDTTLYRASKLKLSSLPRSDRLAQICDRLGCHVYLSPSGASDYLAADEFEERHQIKLEFANYIPPPYHQYRCEKFISHLSIADVTANLGWRGASKYIKCEWH